MEKGVGLRSAWVVFLYFVVVGPCLLFPPRTSPYPAQIPRHSTHKTAVQVTFTKSDYKETSLPPRGLKSITDSNYTSNHPAKSHDGDGRGRENGTYKKQTNIRADNLRRTHAHTHITSTSLSAVFSKLPRHKHTKFYIYPGFSTAATRKDSPAHAKRTNKRYSNSGLPHISFIYLQTKCHLIRGTNERFIGETIGRSLGLSFGILLGLLFSSTVSFRSTTALSPYSHTRTFFIFIGMTNAS